MQPVQLLPHSVPFLLPFGCPVGLLSPFFLCRFFIATPHPRFLLHRPPADVRACRFESRSARPAAVAFNYLVFDLIVPVLFPIHLTK